MEEQLFGVMRAQGYGEEFIARFAQSSLAQSFLSHSLPPSLLPSQPSLTPPLCLSLPL